MVATGLVAYGATGLSPVPPDPDLTQHVVPLAVLISGIGLSVVLVWKVRSAIADAEKAIAEKLASLEKRLTRLEDEQKRQRK